MLLFKSRILPFVFLFISVVYNTSAEIQISGLKVQSMINPIGIDVADPCFSWQWKSDKRGSLQTEYQLIIASSVEKLNNGTGDMWNTGNVKSDQQLYIKYKGKTLESGKTYYWKVRIKDNQNEESGWSEPGFFTTGILNPSEWRAKWITYDSAKTGALPIFRKAFTVKKEIKQALVHVSAPGYYELHLNGRKIGDHVLDPGQTNYDDYALYVTYDVTKNLKDKKNTIGVMLGNGWYNQNMIWGKNGLSYGNPLFYCQLDVTFSDGSKSRIITDESWEWADGPIISSNVYAGEVYDARKEIRNWSEDSKTEAVWFSAIPANIYPPKLKAQNLPAIKRMKELPAKKVSKPSEGTYIFDFGQNFAGWTRLKVNAPAGTKITIRTAEEIDKEGTLYTASTGVYATKVEQTEVYTCKGEGTETWEPRFTYHGFRYAEVTGLPFVPDKDLLTGIVLYSSIEDAGNFSSSNEQINMLHQLARWTLISNLHSVPTDCPAREKCGWLGDAHAMVTFGIYNFGMENFWIKYMEDIRSTSKKEEKTTVYKTWNKHEQRVKPSGIPYMIAPGKRLGGAASPDWGTAVVQIPWNIYLYYGNKEILKEFYPDMKRWVEYVEGFAENKIVDYGLGDWCPPGMIVPVEIPLKVSSTAFHYLDTKLLAGIATVLGYKEDSELLHRKEAAIKKAFIENFYNLQEKSFGSQTANAMALDFGLFPEGENKKISDAIVRDSREKADGFLNTGIFGIGRIFGALSQNGNEVTAYKILTKKGYNSFEHMWSQHDATTLWEILPVDSFYLKLPDKMKDRSHSHPMQGGYDKWFYENVLGIQADATAPGFKQINLKPEMMGYLNWAGGEYHSGYGLIKSDWRIEGEKFIWNVSIPANTKARIYIPGTSQNSVLESGRTASASKGVDFLKSENGRIVFEAGSGDYSFTSYLR